MISESVNVPACDRAAARTNEDARACARVRGARGAGGDERQESEGERPNRRFCACALATRGGIAGALSAVHGRGAVHHILSSNISGPHEYLTEVQREDYTLKSLDAQPKTRERESDEGLRGSERRARATVGGGRGRESSAREIARLDMEQEPAVAAVLRAHKFRHRRVVIVREPVAAAELGLGALADLRGRGSSRGARGTTSTRESGGWFRVARGCRERGAGGGAAAGSRGRRPRTDFIRMGFVPAEFANKKLKFG